MSLIEIIEDADVLEEWLKLNKMRPEDLSREGMERGSREHETLEGLARTAFTEGLESAAEKAGRLRENKASTPWTRAIAEWWLTRLPQPLAAEQVVYQLEPHGGFAGSLDLVYEGEDGRTLMDLKTRKEGAEVYDSDRIQVAAYELAWTQNTGRPVDNKTILVARADGSWVEEESDVPGSVFLHLLAVAKILDSVRR